MSTIDADEFYRAEAQRLAAVPIGPCPPWCMQSSGHRWDCLGGRPHGCDFGHGVTWEALEVLAEDTDPTGPTKLEPGAIICEWDYPEPDPDEADKMARSLSAAAKFARTLGGSR